MEIILRNLRANLVIFINGSEEENNKLLNADLEKRKMRALTTEKSIYKGFLSRTRMKATFTEEEPESLTFKTLKSSGISYADVEVIMDVEYDKSRGKNYKLGSKNSTIKIVDKEKK